MLFNSIPFLVFFLLVFPTFFLLPPKYRWLHLLLASYFFYMYWNVWFILLLGFSTVLDYFFGLAIANADSPRARKTMLVISVSLNLGFLFIFKYLDFMTESIALFLGRIGLDISLPVLRLILPVGISFYTFHSVSYIIDIYRGVVRPEKHFGKYAIFVCFFPLLVAGPIERASHLLPQLQDNDQDPVYLNIVAGFSQAVFGFFKKVVVADGFAIYVNSIYDHHQVNSGPTLLLATYLFAFQIYCDFSGYSDIAQGIAKMMGYDLFLNFNLPYFSKSITEFWRRWHISLSSWLRDYLYVPLGGNRHGKLKTYRNLFITMLLGGLWHGASWTFVIWGGLNGLYLSVEKLLGVGQSAGRRGAFYKIGTVFLTFHLVCLTWVFFRSRTLTQAWQILTAILRGRHLLSLNINDIDILATAGLGLMVTLAFEFVYLRKESFAQLARRFRFAHVVAFNVIFIMAIVLFGITEGNQFIYFQF